MKLKFTVYDEIVEGETYRFRLRAKNAIGWGPYSPITHVLAASVPQKPDPPTLNSVTDASITLNLSPTDEDGGSPIVKHKIFRDDGTGLGPISYPVEFTRYDGSATTFTATVADTEVELGKTYRFVYVANNLYGDSPYSLHLIAGVGAPP